MPIRTSPEEVASVCGPSSLHLGISVAGTSEWMDLWAGGHPHFLILEARTEVEGSEH